MKKIVLLGVCGFALFCGCKSAPAEISGNTVSGKLPDGAKDWFLNVKDSRGVTATALRPHDE